MKLVHLSSIAVIVLLLASGCSKSGPGTPSPSGGDSLLAKEILVVKNAAGSTIDSILTTYVYNADKQVSASQQTSTSTFGDTSITVVLSYNFAYSGSLLSSLTGTQTETIKAGVLSATSTTQINTIFHASGSQIAYYVQTTSTSGSTFFTAPTTQATGNDSALLTYNASGSISSFTIYQKASASATTYNPSIEQTFSYNGNNLSGYVEKVFVEGIQENTVTASYAYDSKIDAAPFYAIFPGVFIHNTDDVSGLSISTTGIDNQTETDTYTTTYNSANLPVTSIDAVVLTPGGADAPATETTRFFYE